MRSENLSMDGQLEELEIVNDTFKITSLCFAFKEENYKWSV
jgi:hypothetical protein